MTVLIVPVTVDYILKKTFVKTHFKINCHSEILYGVEKKGRKSH